MMPFLIKDVIYQSVCSVTNILRSFETLINEVLKLTSELRQTVKFEFWRFPGRHTVQFHT